MLPKKGPHAGFVSQEAIGKREPEFVFPRPLWDGEIPGFLQVEYSFVTLTGYRTI